jgi:hypothetical protein
METAMFISILFLIFFLPAVFLPLVLETFSSSELNEMGVCLENSENGDSLLVIKPCNGETTCQLWSVTGQVAA